MTGEEGMREKERVRQLKQQLRDELRQELDGYRQVEDEELYERIDRKIFEAGSQGYLPLKERLELRKSIFNSFRKLDILQQLLDDPEITEVMINGREHIFVEESGVMHPWEYEFESDEQLEDMIQQVVSRVNRTVNVSNPIADARLADGSRVHVVLPPVAVNGPIITIRRFPKEPMTMKRLLEMDSISQEEIDFLAGAVRAGYSILVAGGTGSGKTTFLNALSEFIPEEERVVVIEDTAELQIQHVPNLVRLETRSAGTEDCKEISIRDLIRASLRMRPSRIIVGEVRGAEAFELLTCLNTGHDGSISTCHANSTKDTVARMETMVLMNRELPLQAIRRQIASGVDIIVYLGRLRDKSRRILEITEVTGMEGEQVELNPLFLFRETGQISGRVCGIQEKTGVMKQIEKFQRAGIIYPRENSAS